MKQYFTVLPSCKLVLAMLAFVVTSFPLRAQSQYAGVWTGTLPGSSSSNMIEISSNGLRARFNSSEILRYLGYESSTSSVFFWRDFDHAVICVYQSGGQTYYGYLEEATLRTTTFTRQSTTAPTLSDGAAPTALSSNAFVGTWSGTLTGVAFSVQVATNGSAIYTAVGGSAESLTYVGYNSGVPSIYFWRPSDDAAIVLSTSGGTTTFSYFESGLLRTTTVTLGAASTIPTVTTTAASSITLTGATVGGNVSADGGAGVTQRGVVYRTTPGPTTGNATFITGGSGTGSYSVSLNGLLTQGTTYYVRAYAINSVGTAYGNEINFTTLSLVAPAITAQPVSQTVSSGGSATFSVVATGSAPLTYQWRKDGASISGATNASYSLSNVQVTDAAGYSVVVTDSAGSVSSNPATLTVNTAPAITTQPVSMSVTAGSSATFSVVATGTPAPTYQWRKDGTAISGATNASYALGNVQSVNAGAYTVVVSNSVGSVTSAAATLAVLFGPTITTQPVAQSALVGTSATFSVVATGNPAPAYQWRNDGNAITGATNASVTLTGVQTTDAGGYSVVVNNSVASVTSNTVALSVTIAVVEPRITTQPVAQSVAVGATATFSVVATGTTPGYQWQKDGVSISGASNAILNVTGVQSSDAGDYAVVLSNSAGSVTSATARLTVVALPTITTQPAAQNVALGGSATLSVVATGTAPLTYQWRKDGAAVAGATAPNLTLTEVTASSAGNYLVVVTNNAGAVTSNVVAVVVSIPPAITAQPSDLSVAVGSPAAFSVTATGTAPVSYQWRKDGGTISGATSASLSLARVQVGDAGSYSVLVSNAAGSVVSATARLTVAAAPEITAQPANVGVVVGSSASFSVTVIGAEPLTYQWQRDGAPLAGRTLATLLINNAQLGDAGAYRVVVSNPAGSVTSAAATLTVTESIQAPKIVTEPESQSRGIGTNVTFRVGVSGTSPFVFQWRKNGAAISGATSDALLLPNVSQADVGSYTVVVANSQGSVTSGVATLALIDPVRITTPPLDRSVPRGTSTSFTVIAAGSPPLTYRWFKDGTAITGATNSILLRDAVTDADAGSYWVTVTNGAGSVTSRAATLIVAGPANRLANLSVRTSAGTGSQTLIVGFVVASDVGAMPVLVRGIGPTLTAFGVSDVVADPQLTLFRGNIEVARNDNWGDSLSADQITSVARSVGAFALDPRSRDAALYAGLQAGGYTAQVVSQGAAGIALVELYEGDANPGYRLVNVSARCLVGTGANILITGFVISGNSPKSVVLRAVGPTLAAFGVENALADPQLTLLRGSEIVETNDDWFRGTGATALPPVFASVGAFPLAANSRDAALVVTLPPGQYTAQVAGAGNTTGVVLVEIYEAP